MDKANFNNIVNIIIDIGNAEKSTSASSPFE